MFTGKPRLAHFGPTFGVIAVPAGTRYHEAALKLPQMTPVKAKNLPKFYVDAECEVAFSVHKTEKDTLDKCFQQLREAARSVNAQ